jgi:hypothetical protein
MIQIILIAIGLFFLAMAGYQDFKTRKPFLIIPALIAIGVTLSPLIGILVTIYGLITLYIVPSKVNKYFGKADIFLAASMFTIIILAQNQIINAIIVTTCIASLILQKIYKIKRPGEMIPLVGLFVASVFIALLINIAIISLTMVV